MRVAQKMNSKEKIEELMNICKDKAILKQMAFMLGRQRNPYESEDPNINQIIAQEKLSE